jgi:hypothetical protein
MQPDRERLTVLSAPSFQRVRFLSGRHSLSAIFVFSVPGSAA